MTTVPDAITNGRQARGITMETISPNIKNIKYDIVGPVMVRASELNREIQKGNLTSVKEVIFAFTGDAQSLGQPPFTFIRQVLALLMYPKLLESSEFPQDTKDRAKRILSCCSGGSIGSYTDSNGLEVVRKDIAAFITRRDGGIPCDYQRVFLSTGASEAIEEILLMLLKPGCSKMAGVMVPIPQFPLYSALATKFGYHLIPYYLDENDNWNTGPEELQRSLESSMTQCEPRAIVVINPGNPTGQVLDRTTIEEIIKFAHEKKLLILADEVYQENLYDGAEFHSFKKVLTEMGSDYAGTQLASFMSSAKGLAGECGHRGGYCEAVNFDDEVYECVMTSMSPVNAPTAGQAIMSCIADPPTIGQPSYDLFKKERDALIEQHNERARFVSKALNAIPGITCTDVKGAMYAFPRIHIPRRAVETAKTRGLEPDMMYCLDLVEQTGLCVVPGSGFGQKAGTYHFRITTMVPLGVLEKCMELLKSFHIRFTQQYSSDE